MTRLTRLTLCLGLLLGLAPSALAGVEGIHASVGGMWLSNSLEQAGQKPAGSSLLLQADAFWNFRWVGFGFFVQNDYQGSGERDFTLGPKMELHAGPIFLESGYGPLLKRYFSDRSIARQGGRSAYFGAGFRLPIGRQVIAGMNMFVQFSYKFRSFWVQDQDGVKLGEPIIQRDNYPIFSVGMVW